LDELKTRDFTLADDPFALFGAWQEDAVGTELNDPTAMALATVDSNGLPDVRMVLLKGWDPRGFVFYTNAESAKGLELQANMKAAALFHWKSQRRQIRVRGPVEPATDAEGDAYFASRPRPSRIGAWASQQSRPLASRAALEAAVGEVEARYPHDVPRPPHWRGFRITPLQIEFWADGAYRLHDRIVFTRARLDEGWAKTRLFP
jgi:pyridoxamine 5'-phosphate oxidase